MSDPAGTAAGGVGDLATELEQAAELWSRQERAPDACLSGARLDAALDGEIDLDDLEHARCQIVTAL